MISDVPKEIVAVDVLATENKKQIFRPTRVPSIKFSGSVLFQSVTEDKL
jgi:hypothetical protein